jgi:hypothetical protein
MSSRGRCRVPFSVRITPFYLGSLHNTSPKIWDPVQAPLIFQRSSYSSKQLALFSSEPLAPLFVDTEPVAQVLKERFGLTKENVTDIFRGFIRIGFMDGVTRMRLY